MRLIKNLKHNAKSINFVKDSIAGIIVALVSLPISMGYAQLAGLPVVYGLYGSLLPILVYGFLTTSPQFVVGVDAMPAVMVGGLLAELEITAESERALQLVPLVSLLVALWFLIFYVLRAGRVVKYISTPVMGGFISGVGLTIILMQVPKLFGGGAGTGELIPLVEHLTGEMGAFNPLSALLGFGTIVIILICKKRIPKVPMTVIMMAAGAVLQLTCQLDQYGVKLLPEVAGGLPKLMLPNVSLLLEDTTDLILQSLSIAAVIMAQTLLATGNYAMKYGDEVDNNAELLAYAGMNFAGCLVGCCPVNGSVSRSGIADSLGCRSQIMSVAASATMLLVLLFGTPLLKYLPVPVLTGIVITALIGILEIALAKKLWKTSKNEWIIFMVAFLGVLLFGTVNGVVIGVVLSFIEVALRAVTPPATFLGRIPGQGSYFTLERNSAARPIRHTVIYRFSGNLFFANVDRFQNDILQAIGPETKQVIVDARGIGSLDVTAADRLLVLYNNLKNRGIRFYLTEHDGTLNDQIRALGAGSLLEQGAVRRTISLALRDAGVNKPYELEDAPAGAEYSDETAEQLPEFEWAFGSEAEERMQRLADLAADELVQENTSEEHAAEILDGHGVQTSWGMIGLFDENEFLDHLEIRLEELARRGRLSEEQVAALEKHIEERRKLGEERLNQINPRALELLAKHREEIREHIRERYPQEYAHLLKLHGELQGQAEERNVKKDEQND